MISVELLLLVAPSVVVSILDQQSGSLPYIFEAAVPERMSVVFPYADIAMKSHILLVRKGCIFSIHDETVR